MPPCSQVETIVEKDCELSATAVCERIPPRQTARIPAGDAFNGREGTVRALKTHRRRRRELDEGDPANRELDAPFVCLHCALSLEQFLLRKQRWPSHIALCYFPHATSLKRAAICPGRISANIKYLKLF
jgi:hypothetical protein